MFVVNLLQYTVIYFLFGHEIHLAFFIQVFFLFSSYSFFFLSLFPFFLFFSGGHVLPLDVRPTPVVVSSISFVLPSGCGYSNFLEYFQTCFSTSHLRFVVRKHRLHNRCLASCGSPRRYQVVSLIRCHF